MDGSELDVWRQEGTFVVSLNASILNEQQRHCEQGQNCDRHDDGAYQNPLFVFYFDGSYGNVLEEQ